MLSSTLRLACLLAVVVPAIARAHDLDRDLQSRQIEHWSFVAPVRPELPQVPPEHAEWIRGPIDQFVFARLTSVGLSPSAAADRRTLIRRVALDLTGLPPSSEDVRAFLADDSLDAYEMVVDGLLASDAYGEHLARYWLDAVRYADTHGLHLDNYREMWPYRDWVIRAFNNNKPYDEFLIEQLAGDLLPERALDQLVATGFHRCHVSTNEGGSIDEEVYVRNVVDRVSTLGTACLGLTLGCAVCHDHKYDPISQKEFYQLFAFFNGLDGPSMDGNVKDHAPIVRVPTNSQQARISELNNATGEIREHLQARIHQFAQQPDASFQDWKEERNRLAHAGEEDTELNFREDLLVHCEFNSAEGNRLLNSADPAKSGNIEGTPRLVTGREGGGLEIAADCCGNLGWICEFDEAEPFSFGAWIRINGEAYGPVISKIEVKNLEKGYELSVEGRRIVAFINGRWPGYGLKVRTRGDVIEPHRWHHVMVTYDGSKHAPGVEIYVDGQPQPVVIVCDSLREEGELDAQEALLIGRRREGPVLVGAVIDEVRIYGKRLTEREVKGIYLSTEVRAALHDPHNANADSHPDWFYHYYVLRHDQVYLDLAARLETLKSQLIDLMGELPTTPIFRECPEPREAFVLVRGQYDQFGERVERQTPKFLPPMSDRLPADRLGLARWLVSSAHPLTSRVAVNRIWQQFLGTGLVKTAEDFGTQGAPPSHPKLLDWLAVEFRESGWDMKALVKQIVTSSMYRQCSHTTPELLKIDPENRLLARGPRFRLDAEVLRDQALAVSGLLVNQIGGASVKPPQPVGLWKAVAFTGSNTAEFVADKQPDQVHRRSIYTFWKRTAPPPQMTAFDAPSREACVVRRERTNTPLQALLLMNDPQFVDAAQHLARRTLAEAPAASSDRARWMFEQVTMRPPNEFEQTELMDALRGFESYYDRHPQQASQLIGMSDMELAETSAAPELATWSMIANLVLNLDETMTKE